MGVFSPSGLCVGVGSLVGSLGLEDTGGGVSGGGVIGGGVIPEADIPFLQEAGIAEIFGPGTSTDEAIRYIRKAIDDKVKGAR